MAVCARIAATEPLGDQNVSQSAKQRNAMEPVSTSEAPGAGGSDMKLQSCVARLDGMCEWVDALDSMPGALGEQENELLEYLEEAAGQLARRAAELCPFPDHDKEPGRQSG
jgi:hypothetical protein